MTRAAVATVPRVDRRHLFAGMGEGGLLAHGTCG